MAFVIPGPVRGDMGKTGQARLALIQQGSAQFSGETVFKDFFVRLPAHINPQPASQATLVLRGQPALFSLVSAIEVLANGQAVSRLSLDGKNPAEATNAPLRVVAAIPPKNLQAGWNRLTLHFLFRKTALSNQDVLKNSNWLFEQSASSFSLAYERAEMFPELRRFPESLTEEKLLQAQDPSISGAVGGPPLLALTFPKRLRDAHLRACAIVGARLGQVGYVSDRDCRLASMENWKAEAEARPGIIVGRKDELAGVDLPANIRAPLEVLAAGQGLLAEFMVGAFPRQHRWLLVSGADDTGLERALLALGHAPALAAAAPNPAVIETEPALDPPNSQRPENHSSLLTQFQSFLTSTAMRITGASRGSESKDSNSETSPPLNPGKIAGLQDLHQLLARDSSLQNTAFLVPRPASLKDLKLLFDLALYLGSRLPTSPVLWPEACSFSRATPPPAARLQGRSVLLLASVAEWKNACPPGTSLTLEVPENEMDTVRIQGRNHKLSAFEPTLGFLHILPSPWSKDEVVIAAGGWQDLAAAQVKELVRVAAPAGQLAGNLCALDAAGRIAVYDTRQPKLESFAQILQRNIPEGLTADETHRQLQAGKLRAAGSASLNRMISCVAGGWLLLLVAFRLLLLWDREWRRRRALRDEKPLVSPA